MQTANTHCCACDKPMTVMVVDQAGLPEALVTTMLKVATCQDCISDPERRKRFLLAKQEAKMNQNAK